MEMLLLKEMERGVKELGLKGFQVLGSVNGSELSDRSLDPMWEMAEKLDTLMFCTLMDILKVTAS